MKTNFIDHIVFIVKSISETEEFYSSFLGSPTLKTQDTIVYEIGDTKLFFVLPKENFEPTNKDKSGFNHIAYGVRSIEELKEFDTTLTGASIKHSGIKTDRYGNKEYIWFDDPSGIRVEVYCRPLNK